MVRYLTSMAAIHYTLSKEVFRPNDEKLIGVVHVTKANKKKKNSFLCIAVTNEKPTSIYIYQVKKSDKDVYKKKMTWKYAELKKVDGKDANKETVEFDLHFDRVYRWVASSVQDRNTFISCLWKQSSFFATKPSFENLPPELLVDSLHLSNLDVSLKAAGEDAIIELEDYQALTERDEADLEQLMSAVEDAIGDAEAFTEQLAKDLSVLDGENIQTIVASEVQVQNLMTMIESATAEATAIENRLNGYDDTLKNIRETMEKIEEKNILIQVQNTNSLSLCEELEKIIDVLDLPHSHQMALLDGDLTSPAKVVECCNAASALLRAMNAKIHPCLLKMTAVQEQQKLFENLRLKFSQRLNRHLNNLFIHLANEMEDSSVFHVVEPTLPSHRSCYQQLSPYIDLMSWLKTTDQSSYTQLTKVYVDSFSKVYEKQMTAFFDNASRQITGRYERDKKGKMTSSNQDLNTKASTKSRSFSLLGADCEAFGSELDISERQKFDKLLEKILSELEPVCLAEQQFCIQFFHLSTDIAYQSTPAATPTSQFLAVPAGNIARTVSEESLLTSQKKEKQINDELRKMMGRLFFFLENELNKFLSVYDKIDSFFCMYLLVRLSQHVMSAQDTGSFVSMTFANCLVQAKRKFDRFMEAQIKSMEETKISKKSKCGILPFVLNFEDFAQQAGAIFQGSERRNYLDKWYVKLVEAMLATIPRIAAEQSKTPREVVMMENFHHLYALLSQLKISCLDVSRKEAKQKYNEHLQAYVIEYFGRPLEKLNNFFEGVQAKVALGVKEDEIGYQLAFSKQELRKVIKEYPGKEVKKGLESLYRKVEKHLCEEENLLQVVWHSMQEEFIRQYKYIQGLIERCYPGSMITLEFSINDILQFFSDIARSH